MKAVVYSQCMRTAGNADKYVNTKLLINFYYFARTAFKSKSFDAACGGISVNSISGDTVYVQCIYMSSPTYM